MSPSILARPLAVCLAAIAFLSVMDAAIKSVIARLPVVEVTFLRYAVGSAVMTAVVGAARTPGLPSRQTIRANGVRAVLVVVTATLFFYGLGVLPLAEALILSFVSPFFTTMLASAILRERLEARILGAIATGFVGVIVIVVGSYGLPGAGASAAAGGAALWGVAAILVSSFTYSASNVLLRARAQHDPLLHIVLIQNVAPALMLAGPAFALWVAPSPRDVAMIIAIGLLGSVGHLLLAKAYAGAPASRLAPLDYTALIWAALIGYFAFDEVPTVWALAGAVLILAGVFLGSKRDA